MFVRLQRSFEQAISAVPEGQWPSNEQFRSDELSSMDLSALISEDDPLIAFLMANPAAVDINRLSLDSPALELLKINGVRVALPFISQGKLIGLMCLGSRKNGKGYSADERELLNQLAIRLAPALQVAQLVRQQQSAALERQQLAQELSIARHIQQTLLPRQIPTLAGWQIAAYYQPARAVGGDFYDVIKLDNNRFGLVIGDVTDKGVPAAMLMAATRSVIRSVVSQVSEPKDVIGRVNELLCPDIPNNMFVTCLFCVVDTQSGQIKLANAGHNLPMLVSSTGAERVWAAGMPLGLFPGMDYEQNEITLLPGQSLVIYSDGITEAHDGMHDMFGNERLITAINGSRASPTPAEETANQILRSFRQFTGPEWEQEDDVSLVVLHREPEGYGKQRQAIQLKEQEERMRDMVAGEPQTMYEFSYPSDLGNERLAMEEVAQAASPYLTPKRLEQLKTAVAEGTLNAIEHGNKANPDLLVLVQLLVTAEELRIRITDSGGSEIIPETTMPDLDRKLAGLESPRGWGLFLIRNMVDEMNIESDGQHHTLELVFFR